MKKPWIPLGPCFLRAKNEAPGADNIYGNILRARFNAKRGVDAGEVRMGDEAAHCMGNSLDLRQAGNVVADGEKVSILSRTANGQQPHLMLELHMDDNAEIQAWTSALRQVINSEGMNAVNAVNAKQLKAARPGSSPSSPPSKDEQKEISEQADEECSLLRAKSQKLQQRITTLEALSDRREKQMKRLLKRLDGAMQMLEALEDMLEQQRKAISAQKVAISALKEEGAVDEEEEEEEEEEEKDDIDAEDVSPEKLMALFQQAEQMERALKQIEALGKAGLLEGSPGGDGDVDAILSIIALVANLTTATIGLWTKVQRVLLPTPARFHYIFNLRELSRVFQGIMETPSAVISDEERLVSLWRHECTRVFGDKLAREQDECSRGDKSLVEKLVHDFAAEHFGEQLATYTSPTCWWCDFQRDRPPPSEDDEDPVAPKIYEPVTSLADVCRKAYEFLARFNQKNQAKAMNLVLFEDALMHLMRINRTIQQKRGSVGAPKANKQALMLYNNLTGKAWRDAEELDLTTLDDHQGVDRYVAWITQRYLDKEEVGCVLPGLCSSWWYVDKLRLDNATELSLLSSVNNQYDLAKLQEAAVVQDRMNRRIWESTRKSDDRNGKKSQQAYITELDDIQEDFEESDDAEHYGGEESPDEDDPEAHEAYVAYQNAKAKYNGVLKARGTNPSKTREDALNRAKSRSFCSACGKKGHWHKDPE
eukprot:s12_g23.t1